MKIVAFLVIPFLLVLSFLFFVSKANNNDETSTDLFTSKRSLSKTEEIEKIHSSLQKRIAQHILKQKITQASVYFALLEESEYLHFTINKNAYYAPASMGKVFMMVEFFKQSEADDTLARKKVADDGSEPIPTEQNFPPETQVVSNTFYTLEDLNKRMIVYSDNRAYAMLRYALNVEDYITIYDRLQIAVREEAEDYMTVDNFSKILSALYNAEYLTVENSEYALNLLTQTTFKDGLVKDLPQDIKVAHKFGERFNSQGQQLHDCGIIYYHNAPYILCVMTKGKNIESQAAVIADTSVYVYKALKTSEFFKKKSLIKSPAQELKRKNKFYNGH